MRPLKLRDYHHVADTQLAAYCRERFKDPSITTVYNAMHDSWMIVSMVQEHAGIVAQRSCLPPGVFPEHCPRFVIDHIEEAISEKTIAWVKHIQRLAASEASSALSDLQDQHDDRQAFADWMWRRDRSGSSRYDPLWCQL